MEDVKVCTVLLTPMPSLERPKERARKVKNAARKGRTKEREPYLECGSLCKHFCHGDFCPLRHSPGSSPAPAESEAQGGG